ncbi:entericidin A/B family lipoprotein [Pseudomarimonas salicorniae]|uniref:Entericidin A/B family lipoprotein n=1 Tax=Pseudomarimonas salicorniae TaxID=2933270 RepID=A0ABT0GCG0_9GAMM|nr:entericidin A/B family lipoprotein [Lysobacter sp. CAU 1642]MCK7592225.1 entericidin A/B family lipoprotein [Lysobacter sp. CAU 1642]
MKRVLGSALLVLVILALAGCNTLQGAGKDIQKAGEAIERAAKGNKK